MVFRPNRAKCQFAYPDVAQAQTAARQTRGTVLKDTTKSDTLRKMKTISIRELHEKTGEWVRRSVTLGPITVTDHGKVIAQIVPVETSAATNPFAARKLRKG